jgi:hypothetical protein
MAYARSTSVPAERSKAELERILANAKADQFATGWATGRAVVTFRLHGKMIRIEIPMPILEPPTSSWKQVKGLFYVKDKVDQETRRRWRAVILYVKAKLESVESNIVSFEEAFMSHIILPNGSTVGRAMLPQIESAYRDGKMPPLLGYEA